MTDYTAGFERFWRAYPAYKRKGKLAAFKSWQKHNLEDKAFDIAETVERQHENDDHFKAYTPLPATYLNQGRYDDYIPKPRRTVPNSGAEVDDNYEKDRYVQSVKKVAFNWLLRRMKPLHEDRIARLPAFVRSLADDARELHAKGELTDKYAQTIRDELDEFAARTGG